MTDDRTVLAVSRTSDGKVAVGIMPGEWCVDGWGIVLVDIARHLATAHGSAPRDQAEFLVALRRSFDREWENPTDWPEETSG